MDKFKEEKKRYYPFHSRIVCMSNVKFKSSGRRCSQPSLLFSVHLSVALDNDTTFIIRLVHTVFLTDSTSLTLSRE